MRNLALIILITLSLGAYGQQSETRNIGSFTGLKVSEGIDVYLKKGSKESLRLEVRGTDIDNVVTEVSGGYLRVHMREGKYRDRSVKVYLTYVEIEKIVVSSAAGVYAESTLKTRSLRISASSAASIDIPIDVEELEVDASSAADVELRGKAGKADLDASSSGEVDAYDVEVTDADARASSAGTVKLSVSRSINAHASSAGDIRYRGNPSRSNTNSSSGGSVRKTN